MSPHYRNTLETLSERWLAVQADFAKPGNAAKAGGASRAFSTEWPSLGRPGMQPAQPARRAAAESRPPRAGKGTETLLDNGLAKDMGGSFLAGQD